MKLARIAHGNERLWVRMEGEALHPLTDSQLHAALVGGRAGAAAGGGGAAMSVDAVTFLPPLVPAANVYCIGLNYKSHVEETARDLPAQPSVFVRVQKSLVGHGQALVCPVVSGNYDYEGELALVIGKPARHVREANALEHVAGLTCFNDGSLRDFQKHSVTAGKNFANSGSCGPAIVTLDQISDASKLTLTTRLNGHVVQQSGTDKLIYSLTRIISYLSTFTRLETGDVIATGTPAGVGARRTPPLWMKAGDVVEVEISELGCLRNPVVDEEES
jgi:2-keto-4-pentenoate hydratase/2-oxohepta-3-ene-1,7-dioic acid hydratase in catechol pathway